MSVLIRGMKIPNRCFECIFLTTVPSFFCLAGKRDLCAEHGININRPDWCPLVEVPPHGNLIDGDALEQRLEVCITEGMTATMAFKFKDIIEEQTTIIEAEGSDT